ncbi:TIGR02300 family protein [Roseomonas gilardii subsp. gilardii]|uniref:TIGR02300 family protein n=1 Tax=Roseomonas gilardii TaxID=257708 RepID=UPI001FFC141B|nr:TIGR02300 family protein [Roseomonas gilardii]UPG73755.1 TIGR02300 family protein [Roseomonas gilardii subsp. gilardii]
MVKPELGTKRVCVACGTKFYDLARTPAVCPKCGTEQPAEQPRLRRPAAPVDDKLRKRAVTPGTEAETDDTDLEDADTDTGLEDAEDLEDADEDLGEEIGVESENDEEG